jgi:arylsulfatase A-like enzyme
VAAHRRDGVALAWGPDVAAGTRLDGATVFDVAPTVLHAVGEPVPDHVDGTVLDCFDPDSPTARRSVETYDYGETTVESTDGDEDFGNVEDRLRGLGYME